MRSILLLAWGLFAIASVACASPGSPPPGLTPEVTADAGFVTVSTSCGGYMNPPRFAGQVMGRLTDGSTVPLANVSFFRVIGQDDPASRQVRTTEITTDVSGHFDAVVGISTSSTIWTEGSKTLEQGGTFIKSEEWVEDVVFELRAPGCDSLVVRFSMQWVAGSLEMLCRAEDTGAGRDS